MSRIVNPAPWVPSNPSAENKSSKLYFTQKIAVIAAGILVMGGAIGAGITYPITRNSVVNAAELQQVERLDKSYKIKFSKYQKLNNDYKELDEEYSSAIDTIQKADGVQGQINDLNAKKSDLEGKTKDLQQKVDSLTQQFDQAKGQPIRLPAGTFTVGDQIPAGRYVISGTSNFQTEGGMGINTILGNSIVGSGDYHGDLTDGMVINNAAPATLTPVQ